MGAGCCKEEEIDFDAEGKQAYIYSIFAVLPDYQKFLIQKKRKVLLNLLLIIQDKHVRAKNR